MTTEPSTRDSGGSPSKKVSKSRRNKEQERGGVPASKSRDHKSPRPEVFPDEWPQNTSDPVDTKLKKEALLHAGAAFIPEREEVRSIDRSNQKKLRKGRDSSRKARGSDRKDHKLSELELSADDQPQSRARPKPFSEKDPLRLAGNDLESRPSLEKEPLRHVGDDLERNELRNQASSSKLFEDVAPGAVAVHGVDWLRNDNTDGEDSLIPSTQDTERSSLPTTSSVRTLNVVATLVDDSEVLPQQVPDLPLVHATKGGPWKDRRVRIVLCVVLALVIILTVVLGVTLTSRGNPAPDLTEPPTTMPSSAPVTSAPTSIMWDSVAEIQATDGVDNFGDNTQLSMTGQRLLVSSSEDFHIYDYNGTVWELSRVISNISLASMSADGTRIAVISSDKFRLMMYRFDAEVWAVTGPELEAPMGTQNQAKFVSVKLSPDGTRVAVSYTFSFERATVVVHDFVNNRWVERGNGISNGITEALEDNGFYPFQETILAFSSDGSRLVIVDYGDEDVTTGFFRVYDFDGFFDRWNAVGTPQSGSQGGYGVFGKSLAISRAGDVIVLSSQDFYRPGTIYCFRLNSTMDWSFEGDLAPGEEDFDAHYVAMTDDGNRIALQNPSGNVRLFQTNDLQEWVSLANDIITPVGSTSANGYPGQQRLATSSDGKMLAIGVPEQGGQVMIYELSSLTD